jgi:hypothetical protein
MASSDSLMASPLSEEEDASMASPRAAADDDEELGDAAPAPATSSTWATVNTSGKLSLVLRLLRAQQAD